MELLSPAGNLETALAAFDGGADAVYCGLARFNARERAENFTDTDLGRLLEFARERSKKVYVTLNTLVWEHESEALFEELLRLDRRRPDALIVQDPGVAALVRKYFPEMAIHASTQMGIHNSAGVMTAAKLGFRRVILERQVTLAELRLIAAASPLELEVFIHGSLCCSLSGRCLLSAWMYGESGNRGRCKQPCRRAFTGRNGAAERPLSPLDLAGYELLEELRKIGIASLKIEGRLRTPDYIWKTARAYRIMLDHPGDDAARKEAEKIFRTVPRRGESTGFYFPETWRHLTEDGQCGAFGEKCAEVVRAAKNGMLVEVRTSLHLGDRLRLIPSGGGAGESFTLASLERRDRKVLRGECGETLFIRGAFRARPGDEVRRIGENGFDFSRRAAALPPQKTALRLKISASPGLWRAEIGGLAPVWEEKTAFAPAEKHPLDGKAAGKVFAEGLPEGFRAAEVRVELDGSFFVPSAELKALRRRCWAFFAPHLAQHDFFPEHRKKREKFRAECEAPPAGLPRGMTALPENVFEIPPFIPETALPEIRRKIRAAAKSGIADFTAGNWHAFALLDGMPGIRIHARYPFLIANSFAVELAAELGACTASITPECPPEPAAMTARRALLPLTVRESSPPLLVSRLPLKRGTWDDGSGHRFTVARSDEGMTELFADEPFEVAGED